MRILTAQTSRPSLFALNRRGDMPLFVAQPLNLLREPRLPAEPRRLLRAQLRLLREPRAARLVERGALVRAVLAEPRAVRGRQRETEPRERGVVVLAQPRPRRRALLVEDDRDARAARPRLVACWSTRASNATDGTLATLGARSRSGGSVTSRTASSQPASASGGSDSERCVGMPNLSITERALTLAPHPCAKTARMTPSY